MAVLTVNDDVLMKIERFAKQEERAREDVVDEAINTYLRRKAWERLCEAGFSGPGREAAEQWLTEDDVMGFVSEEVHLARAEKKRASL